LKHFLSVDGSIFKSNIFINPGREKAPSDAGKNVNLMKIVLFVKILVRPQ
jgi:hypothetical protein